MSDIEREEFEQAVTDRWSDSYSFTRFGDEDYYDEVLEGMWQGWQASHQALEGEAIGFLQSSGVSQLSGGHPAKLYPIGATPSPFESSTLVYTHPDSRQALEGEPVTAERIADTVRDYLGDIFACTRVWEAWQVGTMTQNDFTPADETELADEIATAVAEIYTHPASTESIILPSGSDGEPSGEFKRAWQSSRQEFESEWSKRFSDHKLARMQTMGGDLHDEYRDSRVNYAWIMWQASRQGVEGEPFTWVFTDVNGQAKEIAGAVATLYTHPASRQALEGEPVLWWDENDVWDLDECVKKTPTSRHTIPLYTHPASADQWIKCSERLPNEGNCVDEEGGYKAPFGVGVLDSPEYKRAQAELNAVYCKMVDGIAMRRLDE